MSSIILIVTDYITYDDDPFSNWFGRMKLPTMLLHVHDKRNEWPEQPNNCEQKIIEKQKKR